MKAADRGFTLLELMLALALGALVLAGMLIFVQTLTQSVRQQQAVSELQASARLAVDALTRAIEQSASSDSPWSLPEGVAVAGSSGASGGGSDRLVLHRRSPRNCVGNDNPVRRDDGSPAFWLLRNEFEVRDGQRLVQTCYYGPGPGPGTRQLNAATLVEGIEQLRVRFAEDRNGDGQVDGWVRAGDWAQETDVLGVRLGVLVSASQAVGGAPAGSVDLLGTSLSPPADGRPRLALVRTVPIRSRRR